MNIEPIYKTNEVKGSFWKPDDYMEHVPNAHVIGKEGNSSMDAVESASAKSDGVEVNISNEGKELAKSNMNDFKSVVYSSVDGNVRVVAPAKFDFSL